MSAKRKTITLRQIAELAGTSKSTVSRVLTKHPSVSPEIRARVEEIIAQRGFQPNIFARGLAGGPTGLITVIAPEINSGFYAEVMRGIDEVAGENEGHILSCIGHGVSDYKNILKTFASGSRSDGIVLLAPPIEIVGHSAGRIDVPIVLCACRSVSTVKGWDKTDSITVNNRSAIVALLDHLWAEGIRRIVHVAGPQNVYDAVERRTAFEDYFKMRGDQGHGEVISGGFTREAGLEATRNYLKNTREMPEAFVAFNDSTAYGVLEALRERALIPGRDIAVTGFDDEPPSAVLGLTSVQMPMREMGRRAAALLFDRINAGDKHIQARHELLQLDLRIRDSSRLRHMA